MTLTIENFLEQWMLTVNSLDIEKLLTFYNKKAVLIPTFSNRLLDQPEKIRNYFNTLCDRKELNITLHEKKSIIQPIKDNIYSLSGIYCWRFMVDGELLSFEARFSYVIDLDQSNPIMHHHSSQIPRMI